jgi:hypothetical protein
MSNSRKIFREYVQSKGKVALEFVEIISQFYEQDTLVTKDDKHNIERTTINYKDMVHWLIAKKKIQ